MVDKERTMSAELEEEAKQEEKSELESELKLELDSKKSKKIEEGDYFWLKLQKDFFRRRDVQIVRSKTNGKEVLLLYLELLSESLEFNGKLMINRSLAYDIETIASMTDTKIDLVRTAFLMFERLGWIEVLSDGIYFMKELKLMTGYEKKESRERNERRKKAKQLQQPDQSKTLDDATRSELNNIISNYTQNDELMKSLSSYIEMQFFHFGGIQTPRFVNQLFKLSEYAESDEEKIYIVKTATKKELKGFFKLSKEESSEIFWNSRIGKSKSSTSTNEHPPEEHYYDWIKKIKDDLKGSDDGF